MSQRAKEGAAPVAPPVEGDFYDLAALLDEEDRLLFKRVRAFMEEHVAPPAALPAGGDGSLYKGGRGLRGGPPPPFITVWGGRGVFPLEVPPPMAELGIAGLAYHGYGCPGRTFLADGFVAMELARIDP